MYLKFIFEFVQNYGLSIILFTILVKVLLLPLTIKANKIYKGNARYTAKNTRNTRKI